MFLSGARARLRQRLTSAGASLWSQTSDSFMVAHIQRHLRLLAAIYHREHQPCPRPVADGATPSIQNLGGMCFLRLVENRCIYIPIYARAIKVQMSCEHQKHTSTHVAFVKMYCRSWAIFRRGPMASLTPPLEIADRVTRASKSTHEQSA